MLSGRELDRSYSNPFCISDLGTGSTCLTIGRFWMILVRKSDITMAQPTMDTAASSLVNALQDFLEDACQDWDEAVDSDDSDTDLWEDMPTVDSKTVARTSPIFEKFLGIPLDVTLIRHGGYKSIDEVINELVPRMETRAHGAVPTEGVAV